jgi:hypothetical protein
MAKQRTFAPQTVSILEVAAYHADTDSSLRQFFTAANPDFAVRFFAKSPPEIGAELDSRVQETEWRSSFALLTQLDAAFRIDYDHRCVKKKRDPLSRQFRTFKRTQGQRVRIVEDIMTAWQQQHPEFKLLVGQVKGAFHFRNWLAHGRYRVLTPGQYDYQWIYTVADSVFLQMPLLGRA